MTYVKAKQPPLRSAAMLEREPRRNHLNHVVAPAPWDEAAPGLYPGEALVKKDGKYIAVSVDPEWLPNNYGVVLKAFARWTDESGQTITCPNGEHVEIEYHHTFDRAHVQAHSLAELRKDLMMLLLGEPLSVKSGEGVHVIAAHGTPMREHTIFSAIESVAKVQSEGGALDLL